MDKDGAREADMWTVEEEEREEQDEEQEREEEEQEEQMRVEEVEQTEAGITTHGSWHSCSLGLSSSCVVVFCSFAFFLRSFCLLTLPSASPASPCEFFSFSLSLLLTFKLERVVALF